MLGCQSKLKDSGWFSKLNEQALVANPLLPLAIVLLATVFFHLYEHKIEIWSGYLMTLVQTALELSPVFIFKHLSENEKSRRGNRLYWSLGFLVYPLLLAIAANNLPSLQAWLVSDEKTLLLLAVVELSALFSHWLQTRQSKKTRRYLTLDVSIFIVLLGVSFLLALLLNSHPDPVNNQPLPILIDVKRNLLNLFSFFGYWLQLIIIYSCLYLVYLVNHHWLVKRILSRYGVYTYLWVTVLFLLTTAPFLAQIPLWMPMNDSPTPLNASNDQNPFSFWNFYIATVVVVISTPFLTAFKLQGDHRRYAELQKDKLQTELLWLQQQINPHFLFNTLNNLYSLCITKSDRAPELVLQLANLLRFVVYKGSQNAVSLNDELEYLQDYLALQGLRVENKCEMKVDLPEHVPSNLTICPLLLVNFLENAFKHGIEPSHRKSWLKVNLQVVDDTLHFRCDNSVSEHLARANHAPGIGLKNVLRRLALLYSDGYTLEHGLQLDDNEKGSYYSVSLSLRLRSLDKMKNTIEETQTKERPTHVPE